MAKYRFGSFGHSLSQGRAKRQASRTLPRLHPLEDRTLPSFAAPLMLPTRDVSTRSVAAADLTGSSNATWWWQAKASRMVPFVA